MPNSYDLRGRSVLVTGGAGGIGQAIVSLLLDSGARVRVWDLRQARIAGVTSDIVDITDPAAIAAALATLEREPPRANRCLCSEASRFNAGAVFDMSGGRARY